VRVHSDGRAAESAREVQALAYTVGFDVVFGTGRYAPTTHPGRALLAHELAHVVQQQSAPPALRRTPCLHGSDCSGPNPGDPGRFGERLDAAVTTMGQPTVVPSPPGAGPASPGASPASPPPSRQGLPATKTRMLFNPAGTLPAKVAGIFIDNSISDDEGAEALTCRDFPPPIPTGVPPGGCCIRIPPDVEDEAAALLNATGPLSAADTAKKLHIVSLVDHEAEHCRFEGSIGVLFTAGPDCDLDTVVFHGPVSNTDFKVQFYLSEMSAEIAEFASYYQNYKASPTAANHALLHQIELRIALNPDESIRGILQALMCKCSCSTVAAFTEKVVKGVTGSWPEDQTNKFLEAMTRILPSWWPKTNDLQRP
jgi:hypothetical protein